MNKATIARLEKYNDYKVYTNDIDINGFLVKSSDDIPVGVVESVIIQKESDKVLYLEVNTNQYLSNTDSKDQSLQGNIKNGGRYMEDGNHYMIIPIGTSKLDKVKKEIVVTGYPYANLYLAPRHKKGAEISKEYEIENLKSYAEKMDTNFEYLSDQWRRNYRTSSFYSSPLFVSW